MFLVLQPITEEQTKPTQRWLGKTNFVEIRSFWQIFRSFDRMWSFFVLSLQVSSSSALIFQIIFKYTFTDYENFLLPLQALIIMACHDVESPLQIFNANIFEDVMSIFITSAFLKLIKGYLEIFLMYKIRYSTYC